MDAAVRRILLVEDDSIWVATISQALRQSGYEVIQAVSNGEDAIATVERDPPDLVLMDIELEGPMDGITAAEHIWTTFHIPIIYVSSYATPAIIERAKRTEPFGFLVKPFHFKELHATIETALYKCRMERALQESEFRFRRISEVISDYAYVFRVDADGIWTQEWITTAFTRIAGCRPEEVDAGDGWFSLVHPDDQAAFLQHRRLLLAGEKAVTEYRIVTRRQDIFWLRDYGYPVWSDQLGRVIQVFGAAQDISEQKQAEFQMQRLWRRLDFLLTASPAVIYTASPNQDFRLAFVSENIQKLLDYTPDELLNQHVSWCDRVHPDDVERVRQGIARVCETGHNTHEYRVFHNNGNAVWLRDEMVLSHDDDEQPLEIVGSWSNITERKEAAEERRRLEAQLHQAQRLEALGTLAGGIAHDFNNILGTMLGYTDLLLETASTGTQDRVFLERVHRAGKRAKDLVQQILAFSRTHEFQPLESTDIAPVIEEALHFIRATIPVNITLEYDLQPECPRILANATQIHQVIVNLCLNATHAMTPQGGVLKVVLKEARYSVDQHQILGLTRGKYIKITVTDTGKGIEPTVKERIFEPFFTTKAVGEGSGLGLSVVHGIIKNHHGVIAVESEPGQGAQFKLFFPIAISPALEDQGVAEHSGKEGRASILVVDDEPALVKLYEIALTKRGYHITSLTDSLEALDTFRRQPLAFDIIVVDEDMPELTGTEFSAQVLLERPDIPIILVTGYSMDVSEEFLKTTGIRHCFMKPLNATDLIQTIRTLSGEVKNDSNSYY